MEVRLDEIVSRIIAVNHAWKLSRNEFGRDYVATNSLRDTKSSLQATLLREFSTDVYLALATDADEHDEMMYSVRLKNSIIVDASLRNDAEHLPLRIAHDIFTKEEINNFLNK